MSGYQKFIFPIVVMVVEQRNPEIIERSKMQCGELLMFGISLQLIYLCPWIHEEKLRAYANTNHSYLRF